MRLFTYPFRAGQLLQPLSGYDAGSAVVKLRTDRSRQIGTFQVYTLRTRPRVEKMGRSYRSQRSRYSVSSLLPHYTRNLSEIQNAVCVILATLYARYMHDSLRKEKEIKRVIITFIRLMSVLAIDRGMKGEE